MKPATSGVTGRFGRDDAPHSGASERRGAPCFAEGDSPHLLLRVRAGGQPIATARNGHQALLGHEHSSTSTSTQGAGFHDPPRDSGRPQGLRRVVWTP